MRWLGYGRYADAITKTDDGRYVVADPAMRREIMALRQDPTANSLMAGIFTNSNAKHLTNKLGRAPSDGELYIAHFMGANGAARLIIGRGSQSRCDRGAVFSDRGARQPLDLFRQERAGAQFLRSRAEPDRTLQRRKRPKSARSMPGAASIRPVRWCRLPRPLGSRAPIRSPNNAARVVPATLAQARPIANQVTQGERVFSNPYRAGERRQPVSSAVADLWTNKGRTAQQEAARQVARELEAKSQVVAQVDPQAAAPRGGATPDRRRNARSVPGHQAGRALAVHARRARLVRAPRPCGPAAR